MQRKTHKAFAASFATGALILHTKFAPTVGPIDFTNNTTSITPIVAIVFIAWLTSVLPDVDMLAKKYNIAPLMWVKHRGFTHSIWPILWLMFMTYNTMNNLYLFLISYGVLLGYLSHLVADAFSVQGVAWFYPFTGYKTGSQGGKWAKSRGPFPALYKVGTKVILDAHYYWYAIFIWLVILFSMVTK